MTQKESSAGERPTLHSLLIPEFGFYFVSIREIRSPVGSSSPRDLLIA